MATVYGVNQTKINNSATSATRIVDTGERMAGVSVCLDSYEFTADAAGEVVHINSPPAGSRILDVVVMCDDLGSTITLDIGDVTTANRYIDAGVGGTANTVTHTNQIGGMNYVTTATTKQIYITTGLTAANGSVKTAIYYTLGEPV